MVQTVKGKYRNELLKNNEWMDAKEKYDLILTDDLDSLLGCAILKSVRDWDIEQCMIFKGNQARYNSGKDSTLNDYYGVTENATHDAIGVDFAMVKGKCFDNHLTKFNYDDIQNPESININRSLNYHRNNYYKKYNLSTVLLLWSIYDLPKDNLSDELMMLLIAIDGSYEGFFTKPKYIGIHEFFIRDVLDLPQFLECEKRHTRQEFQDIKRKYNIHKGHGKINLNKGFLFTDINIEAINELLALDTNIKLELPTERFYKKKIFTDIAVEITGYPSSIRAICDNPFCYALTKKNFLNYSEEMEE